MDWQDELGACPDCGAVEWRVVQSHDSAINFLCVACGSCWFHSMGWLTKVDPCACPGCSAAFEAICRERRDPRDPDLAIEAVSVIERRRTYTAAVAASVARHQ